MAPKTRAEIQRAYRERKKEREGVTKKPEKPQSEIQRAYRERKKLETNSKHLEQERERKRRHVTSRHVFSLRMSKPSDEK